MIGTFDPARARETARRIREGRKPVPVVVTLPYDPRAVVITNVGKAA